MLREKLARRPGLLWVVAAPRDRDGEGSAGGSYEETLPRPYFLVKRSMRPAVSISFCLPV